MIYNAPIRSFVRLTLYVSWILIMIPVQAVVLLFSFVYVMINLLIDVTYVFLDPRIRY